MSILTCQCTSNNIQLMTADVYEDDYSTVVRFKSNAAQNALASYFMISKNNAISIICFKFEYTVV